MTQGGKLYQIERTTLQISETVVHYRYDIVNTLNWGRVLSAFSTKALPPLKLVERCTKLNEVWGMTTPKKVAPSWAFVP